MNHKLYRGGLFIAFCAIAVCAQSAMSPAFQQDKKFANVFKPLDGKWKGIFYVYIDTLGQRKGAMPPSDIDLAYLESLPLRALQFIEVEQEYTSETPYLQRVIINDTYTNKDGTTRTVQSYGVNKVENGALMCIVQKPDEKIVHSGALEGRNTIIWQRDIVSPRKVEYFRETIENDKYIIVGWGYYGNDNTALRPKMYFYGKYKRVQ